MNFFFEPRRVYFPVAPRLNAKMRRDEVNTLPKIYFCLNENHSAHIFMIAVNSWQARNRPSFRRQRVDP